MARRTCVTKAMLPVLVGVCMVAAGCSGGHRVASPPPETFPPQATPVAAVTRADASFTLLRDRSCSYLEIRHLAVSKVDRVCDVGEVTSGTTEPCLQYQPFNCQGDCPAPPCEIKLDEIAAWAMLPPSAAYVCVVSPGAATRVVARPPTGMLLTVLPPGATGADVLAMTADGHPWGGEAYLGPPSATDLAECAHAGPWKQPPVTWRSATVVVTQAPGGGLPGILLLGTTEGFRYATAIDASAGQAMRAYFEFAPATSALDVYLRDNPARPLLVHSFPLPEQIHQPSCARPGFVLHLEPSFTRGNPAAVSLQFVTC